MWRCVTQRTDFWISICSTESVWMVKIRRTNSIIIWGHGVIGNRWRWLIIAVVKLRSIRCIMCVLEGCCFLVCPCSWTMIWGYTLSMLRTRCLRCSGNICLPWWVWVTAVVVDVWVIPWRIIWSSQKITLIAVIFRIWWCSLEIIWGCRSVGTLLLRLHRSLT